MGGVIYKLKGLTVLAPHLNFSNTTLYLCAGGDVGVFCYNSVRVKAKLPTGPLLRMGSVQATVLFG